jgi:hypothetical protein
MVVGLWLVACAEPLVPVTGAWTYAQSSVDVDSCGLVAYMEPAPASVTLTVDEETSSFVVDDGSYAFDCTYDELGAYICPDRWPETVAVGNTTLEADGEAHGDFWYADVARGSQFGTFDCVDVGCEAAAAILGMDPPCDVAVSYVLVSDAPRDVE